MDTNKLKSWINLIFVIATMYIVIWYIFTRSGNGCLMTFMMEPPKFIRVPIEQNVEQNRNTQPYKLFIYSEFNFPLESDLKHDLKDSYPVLFVPGNAGSYQQVRSLASTCIRRQLQSIDALKFVFYTIDFGGQLSGLDGQLIDDQTQFVHQSLKQIQAMHLSNNDGIILIGHSVGGFICKLLLTTANFDFKLVRLLISLAGPLNKPYLSFDSKMHQLYAKTNAFWLNRTDQHLENMLSISISGGSFDRLVPTHLSMDPQFDLSVTTDSIKDVWLSTDHVSITWCRELMFKLARLLSALMNNGKSTNLCAVKTNALQTVEQELLTIDGRVTTINPSIRQQDWTTKRSVNFVQLDEYLLLNRLDLNKMIHILNITDDYPEDLQIFIDYLYPLEENGVFACRDLTVKNELVNCSGKTKLMQLASDMPSSTYEPKRKRIKLKHYHDLYQKPINYIVFDLSRTHISNSDHRIPESLMVLRNGFTQESEIILPSILGFIFDKILFSTKYSYTIQPKYTVPLSNSRYRIKNLRYDTQFFILDLISQKCLLDAQPKQTTVLFYRDKIMIQSFFSTIQRDGIAKASIGLSKPQMIAHRSSVSHQAEQTYNLDIYVDGTCQINLELGLDLSGLILFIVTRNLDKIITLTAYMMSLRIIIQCREFAENSNSYKDRMTKVIGLLGLIAIHEIYRKLQDSSEILNEPQDIVDVSITFIMVVALSYGVMVFLVFIMERLLDVAIITNRIQTVWVRDKIDSMKNSPQNHTPESPNGVLHNSRNKSGRSISNLSLRYFEWMILSLVIILSLVFSSVLVTVFNLLFLIKLCLFIETQQAKEIEKIANNDRPQIKDKTKSYNDLFIGFVQAHNILVTIGALCTLSLIANIPSALVRLKSNQIIVNILNFNLSFSDNAQFSASTAMSLIVLKNICNKMEKSLTEKHQNGSTKIQSNCLVNIPPRQLILFAILVPITLIESNICYINHVFLASVMFAGPSLTKFRLKPK